VSPSPLKVKVSGEPIGTCGLVKRNGLDDVDIGFAFLPQFRKQGFALEAASAMLEHARNVLALERIAAIVTPSNLDSIKVLECIGLRFARSMKLPGDDEEIFLFLAAGRIQCQPLG
jgi:RimJ/RimL family protein N-acetyltransferase